MTSSTECVKVIRSATLIMNQLSSRYTFNMEIIASPLVFYCLYFNYCKAINLDPTFENPTSEHV
jgi:hypothetical protein